MEWQQRLDTFSGMLPEDQQTWLRVAAGLIALILGLLWLESRYFKPTGRMGSWLAVRLVSALAAPLTLAVLVLPARAASGPETLLVFYIALFTVAPLIWFGSHVLAGGVCARNSRAPKVWCWGLPVWRFWRFRAQRTLQSRGLYMQPRAISPYAAKCLLAIHRCNTQCKPCGATTWQELG